MTAPIPFWVLVPLFVPLFRKVGTVPRAIKTIKVKKHKKRGVDVWVATILDPRSGKRRERLVYSGGDVPPSKQTKGGATKLAEVILAEWTKEAKAAAVERAPAMKLSELIRHANGDPGKSRTKAVVSEHTRRHRSVMLQAFIDWIGDVSLDEITPVKMQEYEQSLRDRDCSEGTVSRHRSVIRRAFNHAIELRLISTLNPVTTTSRRKLITHAQTEIEEKAMPEADREKIAAALVEGWSVETEVEDREGCPPYKLTMPVKPQAWFVLYVTIMDQVGARETEARRLDWRDVDMGAGLLRIDPDRTKSGARFLPITDRIAAALRAYGIKHSGWVFPGKGDQPVEASAPRKAWQRMLKALGIPHKRQNSLRHACALRMFRQGMAPNEVSSILGHRDLKTTMIYSRASIDAVASSFREKML